MSQSRAYELIEEQLDLDEANTICEMACGSLPMSCMVKCTKVYKGFDCGKGYHKLFWSKDHHDVQAMQADLANQNNQYKIQNRVESEE